MLGRQCSVSQRHPTTSAEAVAPDAALAAVIVNVANLRGANSARRRRCGPLGAPRVRGRLRQGGGPQRQGVYRALLFHVFEGRLERSDHPQLQINLILYEKSVERNRVSGWVVLLSINRGRRRPSLVSCYLPSFLIYANLHLVQGLLGPGLEFGWGGQGVGVGLGKGVRRTWCGFINKNGKETHKKVT